MPLTDKKKPKVWGAIQRNGVTGGTQKAFNSMLLSIMGFDLHTWLAILRRYGFTITPAKIPIALSVTLMSLVVSCVKGIENILFSARIRAARVHESPLFILGHWRTGTTLLHELLSLDQHFTFPTSFTCFNPHCFLLTERLLMPLIKRLVPAKRPQDNMASGPDCPQEEEFALTIMGAPSPYISLIFPNAISHHMHLYEAGAMSASESRHWEKIFQYFLKKITVRQNRPIILKSPTHTFRVATLLRLFPNARFVYLVRNPYDIFPSTVHTWKTFYETMSLQKPSFSGLEEHILQIFSRMNLAFERDRNFIPQGQLYCMRYEDLIGDLEGEIEKLYKSLTLDGFNDIRPLIRTYVAKTAGYKKNSYTLSPELRDLIDRHWAPFIRQHGYADPSEI